MNYIVVCKESNKVYNVAILDNTLTKVLKAATVTENELLIAVNKGTEPLNFSEVNGGIVQDCGSFSRLDSAGLVLIVLKTITTQAGKTLGFTVLNTRNLSIGNTRLESILSAQRKQPNLPILQNAIVRGTMVNAYPSKSFERVVVGTKTVRRDKMANNKKHVPKYISDTKLSDKQKSVLVQAKKDGAYVEAFSNPDIPLPLMNYYKDVIVNKEIADDCKLIIENTKLNLKQVDELYQCAVSGVDYKSILDENIPSWKMEMYRTSKLLEMWGDIDFIEKSNEELRDKCIRMAETLR